MKDILCLNAGSSSLKCALFDAGTGGEPQPLLAGKIENIGLEPHLIIRDAAGARLDERRWNASDHATHETLLAGLLDRIERAVGRDLVGVGHRVVHGGADFHAPILVDDALLVRLDTLCPLAPLHQPHNLAAIRAVEAVRPGLPQVACFDTGFHHAMPPVATRLALPRTFHDQGIRRYGFHGLSYDYIARRLRTIDRELARGRIIAAHLGNGASLCAMLDGKSIDTSMGFTALDGLMMGTRCGAMDPGVILHLQSQMGMSVEMVEDLLYRRSGLLGVSGLSSDMRALTDDPSEEAREAVELFVWRAARECGALAASLGGVDGIVFTAGIGENHAGIRQRICDRLAWLDLALDGRANAANALCISGQDSRVKVFVIPTDEERMIADHTLSVLRSA